MSHLLDHVLVCFKILLIIKHTNFKTFFYTNNFKICFKIIMSWNLKSVLLELRFVLSQMILLIQNFQ